jgi:uncharacterized protein (TIGR03067 family)
VQPLRGRQPGAAQQPAGGSLTTKICGRLIVKLALLVSLASLSLLSLVARGDATEDRKMMDGTWLPVTAEMAGEKFPDEVLKTMKLVIKGENYTVEVGNQTDEGTTKIDPDKTPKEIDIKGAKGPNEGKTLLAIYEIKGDSLRVCYDLSGQKRPSEFATKAETQLFLVTYQRAKP